MSRFSVPPRYRRGLLLLHALDSVQLERLADALDDTAQFCSVRVLEDVISSTLADEDREDADEVLDALLALRTQARSGHLDVQGVSQLAASASILELNDNDPERSAFAAFLEQLLVTSAISTTAAAAELLVQHEHSLRSTRVITEIRPVFTEDPENPPRGAVLVHTLQIGFFNADGTANGIDVALDHDDLEQLKLAVERAVIKGDTLRKFLASSGLESFEVGGEA